MRWYRQLIAEAGFGNAFFGIAVSLPILASMFIALLALEVFAVTALGVGVFFLSLTLQIELLRLRSLRRANSISRAWPEVVESLQSALQSGMTVANCFDDLAKYGPRELRQIFQNVSDSLTVGNSLPASLQWLKQELSTEPSDRTIETLLLLEALGGHSANQALASLAASLRKQHEFEAELAAKQGWVVTTAKLGLAAPWIIVLMLSRRPETAVVYNSANGVVALMFGLVVCLIAYLLIQFIGNPVRPKRVFASVE